MADIDDGCKVYYETICSSKAASGDIIDDDCERIPVRLCAQGCNIQEGEMSCERYKVILNNNDKIHDLPLNIDV